MTPFFGWEWGYTATFTGCGFILFVHICHLQFIHGRNNNFVTFIDHQVISNTIAIIFLNIVVFRYFEAWVGTSRAGSLVVAYGSQSCVQTIQPLLLFILLGDDDMGIYMAL